MSVAPVCHPICVRAERFKFVVELKGPLTIGHYAGSMLRGAFGHALRQIACMSGLTDCRQCALYRTCAYTRLFETPPPESHSLQKFSQIPNPYVIEPPPPGARVYQKGDRFEFHMVLIGQAIEQLALIIFAWRRALRFGLSKENTKGRLLAVYHCGEKPECIWEEPDDEIAPFELGQPRATTLPKCLKLAIKTPLRLQRKGRLLGPKDLTGRDVLVALMRRVALLQEFHEQRPVSLDFRHMAAAAEQIECHTNLSWFDWQRYSHRQARAMKLGGVVGEITLMGDLAPWQPFLSIGEYCHVGKNATFGLGHYELST